MLIDLVWCVCVVSVVYVENVVFLCGRVMLVLILFLVVKVFRLVRNVFGVRLIV